MTDKNKELVLRLGMQWHERISSIYHPTACTCGYEAGCWDYVDKHIENNAVNFAAPDGIALLLTKMREREDWAEFIYFTGWKDSHGRINIPIELILDTTGKLRDAALAFLSQVGKETDQIDELLDWPCQNLLGGRGAAIYGNIDGRCKHPECHPQRGG